MNVEGFIFDQLQFKSLRSSFRRAVSAAAAATASAACQLLLNSLTLKTYAVIQA